MRHRVAKKHLSRTPAHLKAMRRNLAQSLFQYGQVETTLSKAKAVQPFVEKLITVARKGTLRSRQRVTALLTDRSILDREEEEKYDAMTDAQRRKVMVGRSGRRHRTGKVPASYNKNKIPFVAQSVVHKLMNEIAPSFKDRPGGYTRIIRLSKRRIGDNSDLAVLQLVGAEEEEGEDHRKSPGLRRQKIQSRIRFLEGKRPKKQRGKGGKAAESTTKQEADSEAEAKEEEATQAQAEESQAGEGQVADEQASEAETPDAPEGDQPEADESSEK